MTFFLTASFLPCSSPITVTGALDKEDVTEHDEFFMFSSIFQSVFQCMQKYHWKNNQSEQDTSLLKGFICLCVQHINSSVFRL